MKHDIIVGDSNKCAVAALRNPAIRCLWLFGPTDVGKSFLAQVLSPGAVILDPVDPSMDLEALLDLHWNGGARVVMIAAKRPRDVITNPRHLTRIMRGAVCPLEPWTEQMRAEYFSQLTPGADGGAREILLQRVSGGPRTLQGLATAWRSQRLSTEAADLKPLIAAYGQPDPRELHSRISMQRILELVCDHFRMPINRVLSPNRTRILATPRHVACYLIKELTDSTLTEIGRFIGRDHTTVLITVNNMRDKIAKSIQLRAEVQGLRRKLELEAKT